MNGLVCQHVVLVSLPSIVVGSRLHETVDSGCIRDCAILKAGAKNAHLGESLLSSELAMPSVGLALGHLIKALSHVVRTRASLHRGLVARVQITLSFVGSIILNLALQRTTFSDSVGGIAVDILCVLQLRLLLLLRVVVDSFRYHEIVLKGVLGLFEVSARTWIETSASEHLSLGPTIEGNSRAGLSRASEVSAGLIGLGVEVRAC